MNKTQAADAALRAIEQVLQFDSDLYDDWYDALEPAIQKVIEAARQEGHYEATRSGERRLS